ncbi:MAG: SGNH/GDSL hydrolase family protein, partial [Gemmatimonadales bacterium]
FRSFEEGSPGWEQMRAALREIGDVSRARGTPVVFMMFPTFFTGECTAATYPFRPIVDRVSAVANEAGLDVLDLTAAFAAEGGDWHRWWATPYDAHPSSAAHAVAARALASHIERRGWLANSPIPREHRQADGNGGGH